VFYLIIIRIIPFLYKNNFYQLYKLSFIFLPEIFQVWKILHIFLFFSFLFLHFLFLLSFLLFFLTFSFSRTECRTRKTATSSQLLIAAPPHGAPSSTPCHRLAAPPYSPVPLPSFSPLQRAPQGRPWKLQLQLQPPLMQSLRQTCFSSWDDQNGCI
jgi:energy-coupling factor transporter transmembrane protein EcfT